ncbi:MAG TPA: hypothetical protein VFW65_02820 [Pseudonocardiaceae bacterium]|nr:hypothetical protein [Pseudonocardiaceae bacterium]
MDRLVRRSTRRAGSGAVLLPKRLVASVIVAAMLLALSGIVLSVIG